MWRRQWWPTPVLLPGKSHGRRSLVSYSPRGREESDTTERLHFHFALEKEMATHSSVLAWRIPGMGEPGGLPSMGSHGVGHDWSDLAACTHVHACSVAKSSPTLCDPMECRLPGSSVHGIFQARILEWIAIFFSRGSSRFKDWTRISCSDRQILYHCTTWEALTWLWENFRLHTWLILYFIWTALF